jgi:inositol phosphorylceramide mannosyltransferase catalytic subunit
LECNFVFLNSKPILGFLCFFSLQASSNIALEDEFDISMDCTCISYKKKYVNSVNAGHIQMLKQLYIKNNFSAVSPQLDNPKIPLIIHQIWLGGRPLPSLYNTLSDTWKKMHPNWQYILWTEKNIAKLKLNNESDYINAKTFREKADILRCELLEKFGGVYVDLDFECLKPLDFLHYSYDFYIGIMPNNARSILTNGIVGCIPHHPIMKKMVFKLKNSRGVKDQLFRNGVVYVSDYFLKYVTKYDQYKNIALPITYFFPFKVHNNTLIDDSDFIRSESFAIHYWGATIEQKQNLYRQRR